MKTWFDEFGVEELDWPTHSPDLTSTPLSTQKLEEEWKLQKGDQLHIKVYVFEYNVITVPVVRRPNTFVHIV